MGDPVPRFRVLFFYLENRSVLYAVRHYCTIGRDKFLPENPMSQVVRSYLTIRPVGFSNRKNGISLSSGKYATEQSLVQQQYEVHTDVRVTIAMRWTRNTNTMRKRS